MKQIYTISNCIYLIRKEKTRDEFCNKTNISINTIKKILTGNINPSIDTLISISITFNISLDDLVFKDLSKEI